MEVERDLLPDERDLLVRLIRARGQRAVRHALGISRHALARLLAGLPVRRGTLFFARKALADEALLRPAPDR